MTYQPPYSISPEILNLVARISEVVGRLSAFADHARDLRLRRVNRIRTIHGSLAIEGNTLNEAQIAAILDGKRVVAPPPQVRDLLLAMHDEMGREAIQTSLGLLDRKSFRDRYLKPALTDGLIEMTIPSKPQSRMQRYRLTERGRRWLHEHN